MNKADFSYYKPINNKQKQFHDSRAMHKLLIGGYRGGKTYPTIHEVFMMCHEQPAGCEFGVFRNTWDSLTDNVEKDMLAVARAANAIKIVNGKEMWNATKHNMTLWNDVVIKFRPLTLSRKQLKGMNLCGFFIDDPDEQKYADIIGFLFTRLTNPPNVHAKYFATFICANYEGHGWLWKTYVKNKKEGGDDLFAYWILSTHDNDTLHDGYVETLAAVHSKSWMDRFVEGNLDSYSGLIYSEYDPNMHDMELYEWCTTHKGLLKITVTDVGITHPSVVLNMATDFKNIYVYNEFYKTDLRSQELAYETVQIRERENFRDHVIDPSSAKTEQTSGKSVKQDLWDTYKLRYTNAQNSKNRGIEIVKTLLTPRNAEGIPDPKNGKPTIYIDPVTCPNTIREIEMYHWKEPEMSDFDEMAYAEKTVDKDNDCMDCIKYGSVRLMRHLKGLIFMQNLLKNDRDDLWKNRRARLKMYREQSGGMLPAHLRERIKVDQRINARVRQYEMQQKRRKKYIEDLHRNSL